MNDERNILINPTRLKKKIKSKLTEINSGLITVNILI